MFARSYSGALVKLGTSEPLVVWVAPVVVEDPYEAELLVAGFERWANRPAVLVTRFGEGEPCYFGRERLVELLRAIDLDAIAWCRFAIDEVRPHPST